MEIEISKENENPLLKRKELVVMVESNVTPSKKEILGMVCAKTGAPQECVVLDYIDQKYGTHESEAHLKIYNSKEDLLKVEPQKKEGAGEKEEAKKPEGENIKKVETAKTKEEKPAEQPKAEKPAEEKPAEQPKEEKPGEVKEENGQEKQ